MGAQFIPIGEPAHDAERQALRFLTEGLPSNFSVYGNPWLVERSGVIYELDAVVVAPRAIFVVEIKSYRGRIEGTDNDWWLPEKIRSPLKLNRLTAQMLRTHLRNASFQAGQVWVEGFVFLSATTDVGVRGPASQDRVHTKKTILNALADEALLDNLSHGRAASPSSQAVRELLQMFTGAQQGPKPVRRIREYEVVETVEHQESFSELRAKNSLSGIERLLRVYSVPPLATEEQRKRVEDRARWEAQVLGRLGRIDGILSADPPFRDEAGIILPFEFFSGITLATWTERYGPDTRGKERADLQTRIDLWLRIAQSIDEAHRQGVVHRLLRPACILVEDRQEPRHIRIAGFDLAKQLSADTTVFLTSLSDDRLRYAAPEVVSAFSSAEPASDQFSLGALLALLLTGKMLFESTRQLIAAHKLMCRVRDIAGQISLRLDEAVSKMLEMRPTDRFASLEQAIQAVREARQGGVRSQISFLPDTRAGAPVDAENLKPGMRVGADYEILGSLGHGGMSVVYAARHLVSGRTRALKIARMEDAAEEAMRGEYQVLSTLDHPNIVRVIDLSKMVQGRLTLIMERAGEKNLRKWLSEHPAPEPAVQRKLAEDLFAGLEYLEQKAVTHKDLKPDNLLVNNGRLILIDFSLAAIPEDALYGGTALYRDPAGAGFSHASDRFAAALCLFELYTGRHAFDGRVPEPAQYPSLREEDIEPPGLFAFFRKALHPMAEQRFPSARAMRDAFVRALGEELALPSKPALPSQVDATTPLRLSGLSRRAQKALSHAQVHTLGELLALQATAIQTIHSIGRKTAAEIIAVQDDLRGRGVQADAKLSTGTEPPLFGALVDSLESIQKLPLGDALQNALVQAGLGNIGALASQSRSELLKVPGIGPKRLAEVVEGLYRFQARSDEPLQGAHSLDRLWDICARPLSDEQRSAVERSVGMMGEAETQGQIAEALGRSPAQAAQDLSKGLERLDLGALSQLGNALDTLLDGFGGIACLEELGRRFEEEWAAGILNGAGMIRLLTRISKGRAHLFEVEGARGAIVARPIFDKATLQAFVAEVRHLASRWPPLEPETARRTLSGRLPHFEGDPLSLGLRICDDVQISASGYLLEPPVLAHHSLSFVLERTRDPLSLEELLELTRKEFGEATPLPDIAHLPDELTKLSCRVQGQTVLPGRQGSILATQPMVSDSPPTPGEASAFGISLPLLAQANTPEEALFRMLEDAKTSRGFRMLITPPELHGEIGRSVATALQGTWISFEDAFFREHAGEIAMLERAERFAAQRDALTEAAEATLFGLLREYGEVGRVLVLGDTVLLGLCEALDLPRRLYDETLSGSLGFWVLVLPGNILNRQPRFNEGPAMWHLEGATLELKQPLAKEL